MRPLLAALPVLLACGPAVRPPADPAPAAMQRLATLAVSELGEGCPAPHRVRIALDGVEVATVDAGCRPAPVARGGVLVSDTSSPTFDGPAFAVAAGRHTLTARDASSGRVDEVALVAPLRGSARHPESAGPLADTALVVVGEATLRLDVVLRANLMQL
jgi:hypothetical protein